MKRMFYIKIHLYLSGVTLVFMCLMALSGSLHLFLGDEDETLSDVKSFELEKALSKDELTEVFQNQLGEIDPGYRFSYIKGSDKSQVSRPTARTFYTIHVDGSTATIKKHAPSLRKRLMELHKGHGARSTRNIMGLLGIIVMGAVLSGLWLGLSAPGFRKTTIFTLLSGTFIYFGLFIL